MSQQSFTHDRLADDDPLGERHVGERAERSVGLQLVRLRPQDAHVTHLGFWQSGEALRLLDAPVPVDCPVRLIHGDADSEVPLAVAFATMERLRSADVQLLVLKGGGHRLSEPHEIQAIVRMVDGLLETAQ